VLTRATTVAALAGLASLSWGAPAPAPPVHSASPYAGAAGRIIGAELLDGQAFEILAHLTDGIGPRLSGSAGAEAAVAWTAERLRSYGLAVAKEEVLVPHWVRGLEEAEILAPAPQRLLVTALGGSEPRGLVVEVALGREHHPQPGVEEDPEAAHHGGHHERDTDPEHR